MGELTTQNLWLTTKIILVSLEALLRFSLRSLEPIVQHELNLLAGSQDLSVKIVKEVTRVYFKYTLKMMKDLVSNGACKSPTLRHNQIGHVVSLKYLEPQIPKQ